MFRDLRQQKLMERIGKRLRSRRRQLELSLRDLSLLSGATIPTLSSIERGKRDVKLSTLIFLTETLQMDLSDLLSDRDDLDDYISGND